MIHYVTLVPLTETTEKVMGPEWRKEGPRPETPRDPGIVIHATEDKETPEKPSR
jgi:hypothetical protein